MAATKWCNDNLVCESNCCMLNTDHQAGALRSAYGQTCQATGYWCENADYLAWAQQGLAGLILIVACSVCLCCFRMDEKEKRAKTQVEEIEVSEVSSSSNWSDYDVHQTKKAKKHDAKVNAKL